LRHLSKEELGRIERALGDCIADVASELRLVDAADFVTFIRIGQMANLRNLVHSSVELHFKPGTLELIELGEAELDWSRPPLITLPMRFKHGGMGIYFKLRLAATSAAVEIESFAADGEAHLNGGGLADLLLEALGDARVKWAGHKGEYH
jgi:hypothetical protein